MRYKIDINEFTGNIRRLKNAFSNGKEIDRELNRLGKRFAKEAAGRAANEFSVGDSGGGLGELVDVTKQAYNVIVVPNKRVTLIFPYDKILDDNLETEVSKHNPRKYPSYWRFARYGFGLVANPVNVLSVAAQRYVSRIGKTSRSKFRGYLLGYRSNVTGSFLSPFNPFVKKIQRQNLQEKVKLRPVYHSGYDGFDWFDESRDGRLRRTNIVSNRIDIVTQRIIDASFKDKKRNKKKRK